MSHLEIIPNLWLGNKYSTSIFEGDSVLSIGCKPCKTFQNHLKLSIKDSRESNISLILPKALQFINEELNSNHKLLVHCQGGINRSPAIIIAYLVMYKSYSVDDASVLVKTKKPSIRLQQHYLDSISEYSDDVIIQLGMLPGTTSNLVSAMGETDRKALRSTS